MTPKQHILECHCVDFMKTWRFGLGFLGEQGGEETHAVVNTMKRRTWGLRKETQKLQFIMQEHMALVSLALHAAVASPPKKSSKK